MLPGVRLQFANALANLYV